MKTSIICLLSLLFFSSFAFADPIIPWPVAPMGSTHSLFHSYGDYHTPWVDAAGGGINFHYGIDIADPNPDPNAYEPVYCVYDGIVRRLRLSDNNMGWYAIVEDSNPPVPDINGDAWMYSHISDDASGTPPPKPIGYNEGEPRSAGSSMGYIAHVYGYPDNHLHFMRTEEPAGGWHLWESKQPGNLNPMFYFDPAPTIAEDFDWTWKS